MTLLIDNYDSFSYNLVQLVGSLDPDIRVIRNDEMTVEEIRRMNPSRIILSPGPGRPEDAGIIMDVVRELGRDFPILGVCLGHQAICAAFGATVTYARQLMHGKQSAVRREADCPLFAGCPDTFPVARYRTEDREVMAVQHRDDPIFGVQFHPESFMTPDGKTMLRNFLQYSHH